MNRPSPKSRSLIALAAFVAISGCAAPAPPPPAEPTSSAPAGPPPGVEPPPFAAAGPPPTKEATANDRRAGRLAILDAAWKTVRD
ncbi:MAG TPA: hypothetical protein VHK47_06510, partial [Polyangia bacterium]|nr:hypothetical protein [Polyangia bacterium]